MGWTEPAALVAIWLNLGMLVLLDQSLAAWIAGWIGVFNTTVEALDDMEETDPEARLRVTAPAANLAVVRDALCLLHERLVAPMTWRTWCAVLAGPVVPVVTVRRALRLIGRGKAATQEMLSILFGDA